MRFPGEHLPRFTSAVVITAVLSEVIISTQPFSFGALPRNRNLLLERNGVVLSVSTTGSSSTSESEMSSKILSGADNNSQDEIRVVDYASVQDQNSLVEKALKDAKEMHISRREDLMVTSNVKNRLVGINDDVVSIVGREVGNFAELVNDPQILQKSAAYLRSQAPTNLFEPIDFAINTVSSSTFSPEEQSKYSALLKKSFDESGEVTSAFAKTFYLGTVFLPPEAQKAIWAVYVWCRRTDEIVDAPRNLGSDELNNAAMLQDLAGWELRLENLWKYGEVVDVLDLALLDVKKNYPLLSIEPFADMIRGMLMDIPELGVERYTDWDDLHLYCYRVAGTVGLMSVPIFGTTKGISMEDAKESALSLGVAFQITNILRDVGEDASTRNRIYLPTSHLEKFNVSEEQIFAKKVDNNFRSLIKYEIEMARKYYAKAQKGVFMLSENSRLPVQTSLDSYGKILQKIEENDYDCLNKRAYVDKWEKLLTIPVSWYKTIIEEGK